MSQSTLGKVSFRGFETDVYTFIVGRQKQRLYVSADILNKIPRFAEAIKDSTLTPEENSIMEDCEPAPLAVVFSILRDGTLKEKSSTSMEYCDAYAIALVCRLEAVQNTILDMISPQLLHERNYEKSTVSLPTSDKLDNKLRLLLLRNSAYEFQQGHLGDLHDTSSNGQKSLIDSLEHCSKEDVVRMMAEVARGIPEDPLEAAIHNPCLYHEHNETVHCEDFLNHTSVEHETSDEDCHSSDPSDDEEDYLDGEETEPEMFNYTPDVVIKLVPKGLSTRTALYLEVSPHDTVQDMIRGFRSGDRADVDRDLYLVFNGTRLDEDVRVGEVGFEHGGTVEVLVEEKTDEYHQVGLDTLADPRIPSKAQLYAEDGINSKTTHTFQNGSTISNQETLLQLIGSIRNIDTSPHSASPQKRSPFTVHHSNTITALAAEVGRLRAEVNLLKTACAATIDIDNEDLSSWTSGGMMTPASTAVSDASMSTIRGADVEAFSLEAGESKTEPENLSSTPSPKPLAKPLLEPQKLQARENPLKLATNTIPQSNNTVFDSNPILDGHDTRNCSKRNKKALKKPVSKKSKASHP